MSRHTVAIVCALAFVIGGASAFVLEYPPRGDAGLQGVVGGGADYGREAAPKPEEAQVRPEESVRLEGMKEADAESHPADLTDDVGVEPSETVGRDRVHGPVAARTVEGSRATSGYVRVSRRRAVRGGQGLAGRTVGGVKKTGAGVKKAGAVIGKTFGKVGGVFHD